MMYTEHVITSAIIEVKVSSYTKRSEATQVGSNSNSKVTSDQHMTVCSVSTDEEKRRCVQLFYRNC